MRRREFITLLGGTAATWPLGAVAQQPVPVIGLLAAASSAEILHLIVAFRQGLKEIGFVEGQNLLVEYRFAQNNYDQIPALAVDLVNRQVQVIVAAGGSASWAAAKAATATVPIVLQGGGDPVGLGLVASFNRPGGNVTGVVNISAELTAKRLEVLSELVPTAIRIACLTTPREPTAQQQLQDVMAAARTRHQERLPS